MNKLLKSKICAVFASLLIAVFQVSGVSALDEFFYSGNDILYYDPDATNTRCTTTALSGSDNEQKTWNFFAGKGLTDQQIAGIIGNLMVEAPGIDPTTQQGGGGPGRGIAQWTVTERWQTLIDWADGRDIWSLDTQLDFIWHEFETTEKSSYEALKKTTTIEDATNTFLTKYERAGVPHLEARIAAANEAFGKYSGSAVGGETPTVPGETPATPTTNAGCAASAAGSGDIVAIAAAEVGVMETPLDCDKGNPSIVGDCGPDVNKYTDNHLEYWCADYVSWVYKQAGKPFTGGASGGWRLPGVAGVRSWFQANATYVANGPSAQPKPGDVYFIGTSHVGIVEKVENGMLYTISGNTSVDNTGNGHGVGRKTYANYQSNSAISGFGILGG